MIEYPWYTLVEVAGDLQQGDFINDCPLVVPPSDFSNIEDLEFEVNTIDSIILSQSCDLVNGKTEIILVCAYYPLKTFLDRLKDQGVKNKRSTIEDLRKGYFPSYQLLNKGDEIEGLSDYQVVDYRNVYGIKLEALKRHVLRFKKRYRLLPPYREHLSQAFARYFMRVGLPQDLNLKNYEI